MNAVSTDALSIVISSKLVCVAPLAEQVRARCLELGMSLGAAGEVELAVVEAVNNSIEHAYQLADGGEVEVVVDARAGRLHIEVRDGGRPMPAGALANAQAPEIDVEDPESLPEGGMGLYLVQRLMDGVSYETRSGKNILCMERRIDRREPAS
jgi:serine/threonine-protein kinase RsbW